MAKAKRKGVVARPTPVDSVEVGKRLGERVRELRALREWSLEDLSTASGVSRSMLSQIERDQTNPTLAVSLRIAGAFGVSLAELIEHPGVGSNIVVVRGQDSSHQFRSDKDVQIRTLSPLHLEKDVELYEVRLSPRGKLNSAAHFQGTREFLTVTRGKLRLESGGNHDDLAEGDSAHYRADVPHCITNIGRQEAIIVLVVVYSR